MNWFKNIRAKAISVIRRTLSITDPQSWPGSSVSDAGEDVTARKVLGLSTGWACVNLHAGVLGSLPVMVYKRLDNGSAVPATDHWLYRLVHDSPNIDQTAVDFWEFMAACLELRGNGLAYAPSNTAGTRRLSLEPIAPDNCHIFRSNEDGRIKYRYTSMEGELVTRDQREMLHIRGFGGEPLGGLSTISYGRNAFGIALAAERAAGASFKNGLRPSGVLKFADWLENDQRELAREALEQDHRGATNSGKPLILEGGVDWMAMGFSMRDAQMLESRAFSVEDICRWFQTPPVLIGHTEKVSAWGSGIQEITHGFVRFSVRRRVKRCEAALNKQMLTPQDRANGIFVEFSLEGFLRGLPKERSEFYERMVRSGIMTVNECRRLENLPPVPGGDTPRVQMQNVPLLEADGNQE